MITGIPIINLACFVLWWVICIVRYIATEPPSIERKRSVFSGILNSTLFFFDIALS